MTKQELDAAFKAYDERVAKLAEAHEPATCAYCGRKIRPGREIWVMPCTGPVYCSSDCLAYGQGGAYLEADDEDYESWFEEKTR